MCLCIEIDGKMTGLLGSVWVMIFGMICEGCEVGMMVMCSLVGESRNVWCNLGGKFLSVRHWIIDQIIWAI